MAKKKALTLVQGLVSISHRIKLDEVAKARRTTISHLIREAIAYYLNNIDKAHRQERDAVLLEEIAKLEQRIVNLLIKNLRGTAQNLYMSGQQWVHGGPPVDGLSDQEMNELIESSKRYAYQWVTSKES